MAFRTKTFSWTHTGSFMSYGVADFNGDGVLDLAYGGPVTPFRNEANPFHILSVDQYGTISNSDAIFASVPLAVHHAEMVVGDFNGDGRPDFFSANTGYDAPPFGGERNTLVLSGDDGRLHDMSYSLPDQLHFSHTAAGGDIDNDGDIDLLSGDIGSPYILRNDGAGNFTRDDGALPFNVGAHSGMENMLLESRFVDINGDGWLDLVTGPSEHSPVGGKTYLNDGTGTFDALTETALPVGLYGANNTIVTDILDLDINGDGHKDLILSQTPGSPYHQGQKLQILINDGTGQFSDETAARMPGQAGKGDWNMYLQAIDYNGDGHMDILGQYEYGFPATQQSLWLNTGSGRFRPASLSEFNTFEASIVPMDFNMDGRMDFLSFRKVGNNYFSETRAYTFKSHLNTRNTVSASDRGETVKGSSINDLIDGYEGNDTIYGSDGRDNLAGGTGNDRLYGGNHNDTLTGGTGSDRFVFNTRPNKTSNVDTIKDFDTRYDTIWLDNKYFTKLGKGSESSPVKLSSKAFWIGTKAQDAMDGVIYNKTTGGLYYDPDGTGQAAMVKIASLQKNLKMAYNDFFVV